MGIPADDVVLIQQGNSPHDPTIITVNCPDKSGLGCDLCRIILEFGLHITRAGYQKLNGSSAAPSVYLLKFCCVDRKGLLHDVTELLTELEFTIQRLKVMTTPDGKVVDLFFITDGSTNLDPPPPNPAVLHCLSQSLGRLSLFRELLHTKKRRDDTCGYLCDVFREYCIGCELQLAGPECDNQRNFSSLLNLAVAEELFSCELSGKESCMQALRTATPSPEKAIVTVDNLLSPAHTLLQIQCVDQKGLFYDILRTSKDLNIQVAYGRFSSSIKGYRNMDLFFQQRDGKKILDPKLLESFCSRLKEEMLHPLRVIITNRGPDTELLVANPVELCGKGRPRVFYDVTLALKKLGICIFSAEIGRHSTQDRQWEVYRFLLVENGEFPLTSGQARNQMADRIRTLMDW
ncbi:hypothetical protein DKX38_016370 [Salix brachista]|uniref:ACT domain-containing protein ACR n=1 Tax=Salix brachista TaxID=2182728 RepID=A0A5N5L7T1_9ROSI|nr:hypothetical protein DKX38_016370 [Salix brachista]